MSQISILEFSILLGQIKKKWGKDVNSIGDCNKLSEDILYKTKERISPSTLFRWFVLNNQSHKPYQNTLNTLNNYLSSIETCDSSFIKVKNCILPDIQGLEFISLSLQHSEFKGLLAYLKRLPNELIDIEQSINFASCVGREIRNSISLQRKLIPELIITEQGRLHIIELFCDEDALDGYFKNTLEQYITTFPNKDQKKIIEDFIFAAHLLSFSYLLLNEFDNLKRIQREFEINTPKIKQNYEHLHPMLRLRFHLMNALCHRLSFRTDTNLETQTILHVENLITEFPLWHYVVLFELSKTAAILEWRDCMSYISNAIKNHVNSNCETDAFNYKHYIAEILIRFGDNQLVSLTPFTGIRPIEYSRYNHHIYRIKGTLNKLK